MSTLYSALLRYLSIVTTPLPPSLIYTFFANTFARTERYPKYLPLHLKSWRKQKRRGNYR